MYSQTSIIRTLIIRISRVYGLFLWSQFVHEYFLVMIKIRNHILFKTTALKCEGKASLFRIKKKAKATLARVVTNEEHSNEVWLAQSWFVAKWDFTLYWLVQRRMQGKQALQRREC